MRMQNIQTFDLTQEQGWAVDMIRPYETFAAYIGGLHYPTSNSCIRYDLV